MEELSRGKTDEPSWILGLGRTHAEHGLIRCYHVTDASVHDSQVLGKVLDDDNEADRLWADSAYRSEAIETVLEWMGFDS